MTKGSNFSSFPQYFQYISILRIQITYSFVKCGCLIYLFFLSSANLICRDTDISKYFRESLGLRDNESRLYLAYHTQNMIVAGHYGFMLDVCVHLSVCLSICCPSVCIFISDYNLSKYQWIFTKLAMCIDSMEVCYPLFYFLTIT